MSAIEIPADVWSAVSTHIVNPKGHISLSQVSQTARASYSGEEKWKQLCRSIGLGMGMTEKRDTTWKRVLIEAVGHRSRCRMPQCYQYGVPLGDLLPDAQAVLQHCEYFRGREKVKPAVPCSCGHYHQSDPLGVVPPAGPAPESVEGDTSDEDDDEDEGSEGGDSEDGDEDDEDGDWESDADEPALPPLAPDPATMMAGLLSMMGMAPPVDPTGNAPNPFAGLPAFPGAPAGPAALPFPLFNPLPTDLLAGHTPAAGPAAANPSLPKVKPHLLPLSWKNREHVPAHPKLHPFLRETGCIQFQRFIVGETCFNPYAFDPTVGGKVPVGIDWDLEDDEAEDWKARNILKLKDHPLLDRAFATNPPIAKLSFVIDGIMFDIYNPDGLTVKDVVHNLNRILQKPLSAKDKSIMCTAPPPHECHLDDYPTRLEYLLRDFPNPSEDETEIRECWLRASLEFEGGEITCVVFP